jgi:hypothetical protein
MDDLRIISEEERAKYQSIHPVCMLCFGKGHPERKRGEVLKRGQKRKK